MRNLLFIICFFFVSLPIFAQPNITTFSPTSGAIGSSVIITGTGFNPTANQNIVFFGATRATVTASSTTSLTVTVPLGADYQYMSVTNLAVNLTAYSLKPFIVTLTGNILFANKQDFFTGSDPYTVRIGDLDGDGKPDLAIANFSSNTVSIFRNTSVAGTVSFATRLDFTTSTDPGSVRIGDLDGDGKLDLAVTNFTSNTVSILRNISTVGTINFEPKIDFATNSGPHSVRIGDLDGDGKPDLALTNGNVSVFKNTSTLGNISFATKIDLGAGTGASSVSIGDVDGDEKPDLVRASGNNFSVFLNTSTTGTLSFAPHINFGIGWGTGSNYTAIGNLDGDGKLDLVVANGSINTVSIFRNTSTLGNVSFAPKVDLATGIYPRCINIGDIDGDSKPDLAVANGNGNTVSVFKNTSTLGTITFNNKQDFTARSNLFSVSIGDIDGDEKPDLVAASYTNNRVSILRQIPPPPPIINSFSPSSGCVGTASVTIIGNNFTGATAVTVGGINALNFVVNSDTQIIASVGNSTGGTIMVTTTEGTDVSIDTFILNPLPTISLGTDTIQCGGNIALDATNAGSTYLWSTTETTQTISASSSNTYSVLVTDGNNCSNSDTINVTINPLPTIPLGTDIIQCGGNVSLDALNPGSTYLWSTTENTQTINVSSSNTYSVLVTDGNNCSNSDTINVTINPLPVVTTTLNGAVITANQNGATYQWIDCNDNSIIMGATNQNYTVTANGDYAVITTLNTCSDTSLCVNINWLGAIEISKNKEFSIYPNPFSTQANLVISSPLTKVNFIIYNSLGQQVKQLQNISDQIITFHRGDLPNGMYSIHLLQDNKVVGVKKIVLTD